MYRITNNVMKCTRQSVLPECDDDPDDPECDDDPDDPECDDDPDDPECDDDPDDPECDDDPDALAERLVTYFTHKITDIGIQLITAHTPCQLHAFIRDIECSIVEPLCDFQLATVSDICSLDEKASSKSFSNIDVIPRTMLKSNIEMLAPVLICIVNLSIMSSP